MSFLHILYYILGTVAILVTLVGTVVLVYLADAAHIENELKKEGFFD